MFSDPQALTDGVDPITLNRTSSTEDGAKFASSDRSYRMSIAHSYGRRARHTIRLEKDDLVANPLISGQNVQQSMSAYLVVDVPTGYNVDEALDTVVGFLGNLTATSNENLSKFVGGEA